MLFSKHIKFFNDLTDAHAYKHGIRDWYLYEIRKMESGVWRVAPMGWEGIEQPDRMFRQGGK